ncbi:biotin/lipoyl-binding protein [Vibrio maerlii]|uniref:biotin/lipoyl-binding protein n=1 Tax=Vibrio maerlii TaxID=2231648 RepID=UPI000E3DF021|nr:HlyD family efflux transporter periplasmic adaptor subunit [Vibrio maerlii]
MSASLFSPSWYKVADLKVRIRKHANIHRHVYRGKVWFVLQDHVTGQFQRFTPEAYQLIGLMDGNRTLDQVWGLACEQLGDDIPTQDEVIQLLGQLNKANVIQTDKLPNVQQLDQRRGQEQTKKLLQQLKSPLSIKIPLLDPQRFLHSTRWVATAVFSKLGALVSVLILVAGVMLAALNWQELTNNLSDKVLGVENLFLMALAYPVVKLIHELGHGYAVKRWGGEVHEMGVMLLIFIPVPYVDATSASSFRNKYQRMIVGAVGVFGELLMASIAMIIWTLVEPGLMRSLAYNVMLIGGISTLLFNGNPLLRFDAYYVLSDYLEIPNLASRGNVQVGYLVKRYVYRISEVRSNAYSRKESVWLASYAIAAYIYRLFVMVIISLFVASKYFFIGVILAAWSIWSSLIAPILKVSVSPLKDSYMQRKKTRVYAISLSVVTAILAVLFYLPVPLQTYAQGVLYVPQESYVRAQASGFVESILVEDGARVQSGEVLLQMADPDTLTRVEVIEGQLREARVRYEASVNNRSESEILKQELDFIEQEYQDMKSRLDALLVTSTTQGDFVIPQGSGTEGRFFQRGDILGYVVDYQNLPLSVMITEDDIDLVRNQTQGVKLKLASDPYHEYQASIQRVLPASTQILPSATLSTEGGGLIALDPNRSQELQAYQNYFRLEMQSDQTPKFRFDERVHVLFEHQPEPIIYRWGREIRRVFLRQFDV